MSESTLVYSALPQRPSLEQLRKQAKDVLRAQRGGDAAGCAVLRRIRRLAAFDDAALLSTPLSLSDAQFAIALDYGLPSWVELKHKVELLRGERTLASVRREGTRVQIEGLPPIGFSKSGRCSYAGALAGALRVTPQAYSYDQIMAYSGLAFRVRWFRGDAAPDWCPSSALGEFPPEMEAVSAATGWLQRADVRPDGRDLLPVITASIDRGVPVLGYPSAEHLDLGVLCGYERDGERLQLVWLDYKREGELILPAEQLGFLTILLERQGLAPDPRRALIAALTSDNWRRKKLPAPARDGAYRYGALALETWQRDLEQASELPEALARKLCFVSWFCFTALADARSAAATFLNQAADDFEDELASGMRTAAEHYARACGAMLPAIQAQGAFRAPWGPGFAAWDEATRARERAILERVRACDTEAEAVLDRVIEAARAADGEQPPRPS